MLLLLVLAALSPHQSLGEMVVKNFRRVTVSPASWAKQEAVEMAGNKELTCGHLCNNQDGDLLCNSYFFDKLRNTCRLAMSYFEETDFTRDSSVEVMFEMLPDGTIPLTGRY